MDRRQFGSACVVGGLLFPRKLEGVGFEPEEGLSHEEMAKRVFDHLDIDTTVWSEGSVKTFDIFNGKFEIKSSLDGIYSWYEGKSEWWRRYYDVDHVFPKRRKRRKISRRQKSLDGCKVTVTIIRGGLVYWYEILTIPEAKILHLCKNNDEAKILHLCKNNDGVNVIFVCIKGRWFQVDS